LLKIGEASPLKTQSASKRVVLIFKELIDCLDANYIFLFKT